MCASAAGVTIRQAMSVKGAARMMPRPTIAADVVAGPTICLRLVAAVAAPTILPVTIGDAAAMAPMTRRATIMVAEAMEPTIRLDRSL